MTESKSNGSTGSTLAAEQQNTIDDFMYMQIQHIPNQKSKTSEVRKTRSDKVPNKIYNVPKQRARKKRTAGLVEVNFELK